MLYYFGDEQSSKSTLSSFLDPVGHLINAMNTLPSATCTYTKFKNISRASYIPRLRTPVLREKFLHHRVILKIMLDNVHKTSGPWSGILHMYNKYWYIFPILLNIWNSYFISEVLDLADDYSH